MVIAPQYIQAFSAGTMLQEIMTYYIPTTFHAKQTACHNLIHLNNYMYRWQSSVGQDTGCKIHNMFGIYRAPISLC